VGKKGDLPCLRRGSSMSKTMERGKGEQAADEKKLEERGKLLGKSPAKKEEEQTRRITKSTTDAQGNGGGNYLATKSVLVSEV